MSNKAMTKEARREFWYYPGIVRPYITACFTDVENWLASGNQDEASKIIHAVELQPNEKVFSREEIEKALSQCAGSFSLFGKTLGETVKLIADELFPQEAK